jgi:hypothetical protein
MTARERRSSGASSISIDIEDLEREPTVQMIQNTMILTFK